MKVFIPLFQPRPLLGLLLLPFSLYPLIPVPPFVLVCKNIQHTSNESNHDPHSGSILLEPLLFHRALTFEDTEGDQKGKKGTVRCRILGESFEE